MSFLKEKKNFFLLSLIFLTILLLIFARYNGNNHSAYKHIWLFLNGSFQQDIYEINSLPITTSIYYLIFNKLGISLDNDNVGIIFHLFLSLFALIYFSKILKKIFPELENLDILIIALSLSVLDNFVLETTRSGWIYHQTLSSSHVGLAFFFYFVWQTINNNRFNLFFSAPIFLLISIKLSWFPIGCALVYIFYQKKNFKDILWIFPCILISIIYSIKFYVPTTANENFLLFQEVLKREADEVAIHLQHKSKIILCLFSFIIYYFLLRFFKDNKYINFFKIIFILSILSFCFGLLYGKYGLYIYPNPQLLILNSVRSLYYFQFLLGILYCVFILTKLQNNLIKYPLLLIPFLMCYSLKGMILASAVVLICFFFKNSKLNYKIGLYFFIFLIFGISINSAINRFKKFDLFTYSKINHWSTFTKGNQELKEFFLNIRGCDDFLIYDDIALNTDMNFFAKKSKFYKDNHQNVSLDYNLFTEHNRRQEIIKNIQNNNHTSIENVKNENFLYVTKRNLDFNVTNTKKSFVNLYFFFTDDKTEYLKKNCPNLF